MSRCFACGSGCGGRWGLRAADGALPWLRGCARRFPAISRACCASMCSRPWGALLRARRCPWASWPRFCCWPLPRIACLARCASAGWAAGPAAASSRGFLSGCGRFPSRASICPGRRKPCSTPANPPGRFPSPPATSWRTRAAWRASWKRTWWPITPAVPWIPPPSRTRPTCACCATRWGNCTCATKVSGRRPAKNSAPPPGAKWPPSTALRRGKARRWAIFCCA